MSKFTVLVSSIGSLVGQNILDILKNRRAQIRLVGTNSEKNAGIYSCDKTYLVPPSDISSPDYTETFLKIVAKEKPDIVIPARDMDVTVLAELKELKPSLMPQVLCGSSGTAKVIQDKWESYRMAREYDLPFAGSVISQAGNDNSEIEALIEEGGFPLIVKERKGFGSNKVKIVYSRNQLEAYQGSTEYIFQEYLGDKHSCEAFYQGIGKDGVPLFYSLEQEKFAVQVMIGKGGKPGDIFTTVHKMKNGVSISVEKYNDMKLTEVGQKYARVLAELNWRGPLNIQCQLSGKGEFKAYELSGRLTGASFARYLLGFDELGMALKLLSGFNLEPCARYASQQVALKQAGTIIMSNLDVNEIEKNRERGR